MTLLLSLPSAHRIHVPPQASFLAAGRSVDGTISLGLKYNPDWLQRAIQMNVRGNTYPPTFGE
jgi:hypothetical protein